MKIDDFLDSPTPNNQRAGAVRIDDFLGANPAPIASPMGEELFDPITGVQYAGSKPTRPIRTGSVLDGTVLTEEMRNTPVDPTRSIPNLSRPAQPPMLEMREWVPPQPRGFLRAIADTALGVYQGGAGMIKGVADNVNAGDNAVSKFFETAIAGADRLKSDDMRNQQAIRNMEIYAARKNAGETGAARAAFRSAFDYPAAGMDVVARGAGSLAPTVGLGLAGAGAKTMGAVNMFSNAGDAASQTADQLRALPALVWATDPQYQELISQGMSHQEAVAFLAPIKAIPAQAVGAVTGLVSGATGVEKMLAGKAVGNTVRNRVGRVGTEILTEQGETVAPMITGNITVGGIDGQTTPTQGIGQAAVDTLLGTVPGAGLAATRVPERKGAPQDNVPPSVPNADPAAPAPAGTSNLAPAGAPSVAPAPNVNALVDLIRDTANPESKLQAPTPTETPSIDAFLDSETQTTQTDTNSAISETPNAISETPALKTDTGITADEVRAAVGQALDQNTAPSLQINPLTPIDNQVDQTLAPDPIEAPSASTQAAEPTTAQKAQAQIPAQIQAPAFIDGNRALQITEPSPGMRPGDITGVKGTPFKNKSSAQKVAKEAGPGWRIARSNGGFVVRFQPATDKQIANAKRQVRQQRSIDTERDSMFAAIAKMGGVSREQLIKEWGADPADLKNLYGAGIMRVATAKGLPLDTMGEYLAESGYLSTDENGKHDMAEFEELFFNELSGSKHYTPEGYTRQVQAEEQARYEYYLSEQDAKAAGLDQNSEQAQDLIEEQLDEFQELTEADYAKLEQEAIAWEQSATQQDSIPDNADETIDERGGRMDQADERIEPNTSGESQGDTNPNQAFQAEGQEQASVRGEGAGQQGTAQEGFSLEGETEREIREREERDAARRKADEQKQQEAENKAKADAERDSFALTGSDRTADTMAAQGQQGLFEQANQQPASDPTPTVDLLESTSVEGARIEDFGEKLGGARKDKAASLSRAFSDDEIASQPFSKIWPAAEIDAIEDKFVAAVAATARAEVPTKPRTTHKVRRWVEKVKSVRELAAMINDGKVTKELFVNKLSGIKGLDQFRAKVALLEAIDRTQWNRIGAVGEYPNAYRYEGENKVSTPVVRVEIDGKTVHFDNAKTVADALERVNEKLGKPKQDKKMQFEIRMVKKTGEHFINKKGDREYRKLASFKTFEEAREYRDNNYEELVAAWEGVKESDNVKKSDVRSQENRPRTGADHRQGKDVSAEQFADTFGFRGVEFGNWVSQGGNAKERQGMLNQAYDALLDLAEIVGVPAKAISLNGSLGLGFGSRGSGNASAHFEPDTLVINLTKTKGAGSLAHEWFHALDNYFARMRNPKVAISQEGYRQANFITYRPEQMLVHKDNPRSPLTKGQLERYRRQNPTSKYFEAENWKPDPAHPQGVRPEIETAFADLVKALDESPMLQRAMSNDKGEDGYWSRIIERAARSFENYVISKMMEKGYNNDYLANVRPIEDFARSAGRYPYLLPEEVAPIAQAFDELFAVAQTRPTDKGVAIFRNDNADVKQPLSESAIAQVLEERLAQFAYQPSIIIAERASDVVTLPAGANDGDISGVTLNGRIYLFRAGLADRAQVTQTLWHEMLHFGIRRFMTREQYIAATQKLYDADSWIKSKADAWLAGKEAEEVIAIYGQEYARARGVDEALAALAESNQGEFTNNSLKAKAIRTVSRWIAFLADKFGFTDMAKKWRAITNDEARDFIRTIFARLRNDAQPVDGNSGFRADPTFSNRANDPQGEQNPQEDLDLPTPSTRFEPLAVRDFVSVEMNNAGRREYVAGRKLYDRLSTYATDYFGTLKLADNKPDAFKQMMRQFKVDQFKATENAKRIAEAGKDLTPEQREMISDIMEKQLKAGDVPPDTMTELAATMGAALDVQARELVDLGMLSEDRLVKDYLPRLYKHGLAAKLTNPALMASWFTKARMKIRGERLKSRGMYAEIRTDKVEQAKKLGWRVAAMTDGNPIPEDLFEAFDKSQPIPPNYRDVKVMMWRDYTESERQEMGEIRDGVLRYAMGYVETQKDVAIGRLFKAISQNPDLAKTFNPGGWVQVPTTEITVRPGMGVKAYGALAGMYVEPQVADALKRNTQPKGVLMAMYDKALNFWKEGKTVWNPVAHGNNVVSNLFTAYFAGVNPASPARWRETIREFRTRGKYWNEAVDNGLFGNEFANQEIQDLLMPDFADMADLENVAASRVAKVIEFSKKYPGRPISWYREKMQKAYEFEDQFFKLMLYIDRRKAGMDPQEAITDAERYVFNYSDMPEGVELIKRTYSPFFAYTYKAIPMVLHTAMTRPDRMIAPIALLGGANWLAYTILGADEEKERKGMPEYMQGRTVIGTPKAVRMPFDVEGKPAFMDMSRRVPLGDLFDINNQTNGLPVPAPFMPSHPVISIMQAVLYNQDTFTGKDLVKKSDTSWEAAQARAGYLYRQFTPNAPFIPGSYNFNKLADATAYTFDTEMGPYTGRTKAGDPIPLATTLPDVLTGTKIRAFDPERGIDYQRAAIAREEKEVRANMRSADRNQSMTEDSRARYNQRQRDKLDELRKRKEELGNQ